MGQPTIKREARAARRTRRLGPHPACACGWADPVALQRDGETITCYECACARDGRVTVEAHHVWGKANDPTTVGIPGNIHRLLSEAQREWPEQIRYNAARDPLLWIAGGALSQHDCLALTLRFLPAIVRWLISLVDALRDRHGDRWWEELGVGTPWAAMTS
jgi:hypothetical protein